MTVAIRHHTGLVLLLWIGAMPAAMADALAELPAKLAGKLLPVAEISLDSLDRDSREQLETARRRVTTAIDSGLPDAELADAYGELGALYQVQFVFRLAETCYRNARRLAPQQFRWTYYAAYLAVTTGEIEQAVVGLEQARQLRPDYLAVTLRLADAWLELNRLDEAQAAYRQLVEAEGLKAAALYGLGQIALLQRDHAAAVNYFERALAIQPDANRIHYSLARALRAAGHEDDARLHMAQMGDRLPSVRDPQVESLQALKQGSRVHFIHGMKAYRQHDYAAAHKAFARGLEREPGNASARISYARALYLDGNKKQARQELEAALSTDPSSALACYLLGVLAEEEGETTTASERYRQAIQRDAGHAGAHLQLGNLSYRQGLLEQALTHYAASVRAAPENPAVYLPYTGALLQSGSTNTTVMAIIDGALQRFPEHPMLGYLQIQLQACTDTAPACNAQVALERANRLAEQQWIPPHRELQALALAATGKFSEAASIQQVLVADAVWSMPVDAARLAANQKSYQAGKLPGADQLFSWSLLQPPRAQGIAAFRDYPSPRPY